jgi:hypothetical protein
MKLNGQVEAYVSDPQQGKHVLRQPYDGKLVATLHTTLLVEGGEEEWAEWADELTRKLDRFMRDNNLSRLECYWNAVPPEDDHE